MEVVGVVASAVTLAALFKSCIEAFDTIQLYKSQDADFRKVLLRLNVEKCRLYIWGRSMCLTSGTSGSALDDFPFLDIVEECLRQIVDIFNDSNKIQEKYGCKVYQPESTMDALNPRQNYSVQIFAMAFNNFWIRSSPTSEREGKIRPKNGVLHKTLWVIHDRKKFDNLVKEVQDLTDGLRAITKGLAGTEKQEEDIGSRIMSIRDMGTLETVADVCSGVHPQIAYAASTKADSMSVDATEKLNVAAWLSEIESEEPDGISAEHLENLTMTELKNLILRYQKEQPGLSMTQQEPHKEAQGIASIQALQSLDADKNTPEDMRLVLVQLFALSRDLAIPAVNGSYMNPLQSTFFFSTPDGGGTPPERFRARVNVENDRFAQRIRSQGPKYNSMASFGSPRAASHQDSSKRDFVLREVEELLQNMRGSQIPGESDTRAIFFLFQSYSAYWPRIAREHKDIVGAVCNEFLNTLMEFTWPKHMHAPLRRRFLDRRMGTMMDEAQEELERLTRDMHVSVPPYDPEYEERLMKWRAGINKDDVPFSAAEEVLEKMLIYYEVAHPLLIADISLLNHALQLSANTFIRNTITQVIERHLCQGMCNIFTSVDVMIMPNEIVSLITEQNVGDSGTSTVN
jgi:hypothetical protein